MCSASLCRVLPSRVHLHVQTFNGCCRHAAQVCNNQELCVQVVLEPNQPSAMTIVLKSPDGKSSDGKSGDSKDGKSSDSKSNDGKDGKSSDGK